MKLPYKIRRKVVGKRKYNPRQSCKALFADSFHLSGSLCCVHTSCGGRRAAAGGDEVACDLEYEVTAELMH